MKTRNRIEHYSVLSDGTVNSTFEDRRVHSMVTQNAPNGAEFIRRVDIAAAMRAGDKRDAWVMDDFTRAPATFKKQGYTRGESLRMRAYYVQAHAANRTPARIR